MSPLSKLSRTRQRIAQLARQRRGAERVLLGIDSVNKIPHMLFGDIGLLMTLDWTAIQIHEGVCRRGKGKHNGPIHKDTLPDCLERLGAEEITQCLPARPGNDGIKLLRKIGIRFSAVFALDATDLKTTAKCKGAGCHSPVAGRPGVSLAVALGQAGRRTAVGAEAQAGD